MKNKRQKKHICRNLLVTFLLVGVLCFLIALTINAYVKSCTESYIINAEDAVDVDADCILILGAGVRDDNTPSHMLEDRLIVGIDLYDNTVSNRILMSGDHGRKGYDEVNTMKSFAISRGASSEDIFMDHAGFSTYESMYRAKEIFGVTKMIVVTQEYHLYRALYIARSLGIDAYGVSADIRTYRGQELRDIREMVARVKDFFYVIFSPEPTYLGEAIPISGNGDITNDQTEGNKQ